MPRSNRNRGFTLIELMIAMVVSAIVVMGIFAFSSIQRATIDIQERNVRIQQALEGAMWAVAQDVRVAGMGHARLCTELRVWDSTQNRLINPGATVPATAALDLVTREAYWVLRDGFQAHWNSTGATSIAGSDRSSASPTSAADSFDVIVADPIYIESAGVFALAEPVPDSSSGAARVHVQTGPLLDNGNAQTVAEVQQLFPPGSFILVTRPPNAVSVRPESQGQCMLLQVTGDVVRDPGDANSWFIPIANSSGFNENLGQLVSDSNGGPHTCNGLDCDDWDPTTDNGVNATVVPLGHLRWSRYEIDYTIPTLPYLVRYDIIGYQPDVDPVFATAIDYPSCNPECVGPQLHLPGSSNPPQAVAIGPMVEDMQVSVGCDGYVDGDPGGQTPLVDWAPPDDGYAERGPAAAPNPNQPNRTIDENTVASGLRTQDEWLGNARSEVWAADCVYYGTGQYHADQWVVVEGTQNPPPAFRMSPQSFRITLLASTESDEGAGGFASDQLQAIEDRPELPSTVGRRLRFSLTERFTPENLRWRDPSVL